MTDTAIYDMRKMGADIAKAKSRYAGSGRMKPFLLGGPWGAGILERAQNIAEGAYDGTGYPKTARAHYVKKMFEKTVYNPESKRVEGSRPLVTGLIDMALRETTFKVASRREYLRAKKLDELPDEEANVDLGLVIWNGKSYPVACSPNMLYPMINNLRVPMDTLGKRGFPYELPFEDLVFEVNPWFGEKAIDRQIYGDKTSAIYGGAMFDFKNISAGIKMLGSPGNIGANKVSGITRCFATPKREIVFDSFNLIFTDKDWKFLIVPKTYLNDTNKSTLVITESWRRK